MLALPPSIQTSPSGTKTTNVRPFPLSTVSFRFVSTPSVSSYTGCAVSHSLEAEIMSIKMGNVSASFFFFSYHSASTDRQQKTLLLSLQRPAFTHISIFTHHHPYKYRHPHTARLSVQSNHTSISIAATKNQARCPPLDPTLKRVLPDPRTQIL